MGPVLKSAIERIRTSIRDVPDFPKPGILFKDITPVLQDAQLFRLVISMLADRYYRKLIDQIVAIDARGFLLGSALAYVLGTGVVIARKKGKLPWQSVSASYQLEYGEAILEMHRDSLKPGQNVLVVDDLLATGGTVEATLRMVQELGATTVECAFLVELEFLKGRERLGSVPVFSLVQY